MIAFQDECKRIRFRWDVEDADQDEVGSPFLSLRSDGLFARSCALVERDIMLRLTVGGGLFVCRGDHVVQSMDGREVMHAVPLVQTRALRVPLVSRASTMRKEETSSSAYQLQVREEIIQHAVVLVWSSAPSSPQNNAVTSWHDSPLDSSPQDALSVSGRHDSFERPVASGNQGSDPGDDSTRDPLSASSILFNGSFLSRRSLSAQASGMFRLNSRSEASWPIGSKERALLLAERCLPLVFGSAGAKSKFLRALTPLLKRELTSPPEPQEISSPIAAEEPTVSKGDNAEPPNGVGTVVDQTSSPMRSVVELSPSTSRAAPAAEVAEGADTSSVVEDTLIEASTAVAQRMIERLTAVHTVICSPFGVTNQPVENSRVSVATNNRDAHTTLALLEATKDPIPFIDVLKSRRPETTDATGLAQFFDTCHQLYRKQHDEVNRHVAELSVNRRVGFQLLSHITGPGVCDLFRGWALQRKRETNALQQYCLELQHIYWDLVEAERDELELQSTLGERSEGMCAPMQDSHSDVDSQGQAGDGASMPSWCTRTVASITNPLSFYDASATTTRRLELCRRLHANITELLARQAKRNHSQQQAADFPRVGGRRVGNRTRSNVLPDIVADQLNAVMT